MPITVSNRQRKVRVEVGSLSEFASRALIECLKLERRKFGSLADLREVAVILVSDNRIAQLHRRFMNEAGATDVITFQHGEIFISTETAKRQARQFGSSLEHELRLYIVHGLLHLIGKEDQTAAGAAKMKSVQEKLLRRIEQAIDR